MGLSIASPYLLYETQVGSQYIKIHILHCGVITALRREREVSEKKSLLVMRTFALTYQSCTALKDSSFVMSYIKIKPMAPR